MSSDGYEGVLFIKGFSLFIECGLEVLKTFMFGCITNSFQLSCSSSKTPI